MSSHHIVREKQEPALLVLGINFDDEQLGQLLEWSPTVMATRPIAEKLNSYGIKLDWVISDGYGDEIQSDIKILPANNDPLQSAMGFLTDNGYPSVNVITDELYLESYVPFIDKINLVIFYNNQKIYPVTSGFSKWKPADETIEVLSPSDDLSFTGLTALSSNQFKTISDGFFTLNFNAKHVFLAEKL